MISDARISAPPSGPADRGRLGSSGRRRGGVGRARVVCHGAAPRLSRAGRRPIPGHRTRSSRLGRDDPVRQIAQCPGAVVRYRCQYASHHLKHRRRHRPSPDPGDSPAASAIHAVAWSKAASVDSPTIGVASTTSKGCSSEAPGAADEAGDLRIHSAHEEPAAECVEATWHSLGGRRAPSPRTSSALEGEGRRRASSPTLGSAT